MNILAIITLAAALPVEAYISRDGGIVLDKAELSFRCRTEGKNCKIESSFEESANPERTFTVTGLRKDTVFSGSWLWEQEDANTIKGTLYLKCEKDIDTQDLSPNISFPYQYYPSGSWNNGKKTYSMGEKGFFRKDASQNVTLSLPEGKEISLSFEDKTDISVSDFSKWSNSWVLRFGLFQGPMSLVKGDKASLKVRISSKSGINLHQFQNCTLSESDKWIRIETVKDFTPGSALDFSSMKLLDAPAGKYGWIQARNGSFYFEGKPDEPQRFLGANLCMSANFLPHELADTLIDRFVSMGYNAIRIHHHDRDLLKGDNWDRLDYLIARAISKGIYFTTDMYVNRVVKYSDIGLPDEGEIPKGMFKSLIGVYEPAFQNWCEFSKMFMEHVNPYTGRAYKDEPAIAFISLVNEGKFSNCGNKNYPPFRDEWLRFGGEGTLTVKAKRFKEFEAYLTRKIFEKCSAYMRSLGCKALLSNDNNGRNHKDGTGCLPLYDYVDNHYYIDHHKFIGRRYTLPSTIKNINCIYEGGVWMLQWDFVRNASKPYTITEWNFCGPNMYRSMGGMLCGGTAAVNNWDGMYRFAYSHTMADVAANPNTYPSTFNLATDPLNLASERATVCLFLRKDVQNPEDVVLDKEKGTMRVCSERTCGFFAYDGEVSTGALTAHLHEVPATVWVSSLDGKAIKDSERMLFVHLTNVQGIGTTFADEHRNIILKWGKGCIIERGSADVSIEVAGKGRFTVYELRGNGDRARSVESKVVNGRLCFTASTNGPDGGRMYYEIVRK